MGSIDFSGANARLSYNLKGAHVARMRCVALTPSYGVKGAESHARRYRAFYPYRRVQGTFGMTFAFIHWREYEQGMAWFRRYIEEVIDQKGPSYMQVRLDSRNFLRLGYPTTGIAFGDHTGSLVFAPTINFISVADPRDPQSGIDTLNKAVSQTKLPQGQTATNWFYPGSKLNHPGQLQSYLYNQVVQTAAEIAAEVQDALNGIVPPPNNPKGAFQ